MKNAYDYPKPSQVRGELGRILGYGILFAEGETHKRQKRIINPSFSTSHIKEMVPVFTQHAHKASTRNLLNPLIDPLSGNSGTRRV